VTESAKPQAIGLSHIALEVGDIEEALAFYRRLFEFKLRGKSDRMASLISVTSSLPQKGRKQAIDDGRHFALVVDDKEAARSAL
jgi:lactoylglutathione lyase